MKKVAKAISYTLAVFVGLCVVSLLAAAIWFGSAPRSVSPLLEHVKKQVSAHYPDLQLKIQDASVHWPVASSYINVHLSAVQLRMPEQELYIDLPKVTVAINLPDMLAGRVGLRDVTLDQPNIWLMRNADGIRVAMGKPDASADGAFAALLAGWFGAQGASTADDNALSSAMVQVGRIVLHDADVRVVDEIAKKIWHAPHADIAVMRAGAGSITAHLESAVEAQPIDAVVGDRSDVTPIGTVKATADFDLQAQRIEARIDVSKVDVGALATISEQLSVVKQFTLPLEGSVVFISDFSGAIESVDMMLDGAQGSFTHPEYFPQGVPLDGMHIKASSTGNFSEIKISELRVSSQGVQAAGEGMLLFPKQEKASLSLTMALDAMPVDAVAGLWPEALVPAVRTWITQRIHGGKVESATLALTQRFMLEKPQETTPMPAIVDTVLEDAGVGIAADEKPQPADDAPTVAEVSPIPDTMLKAQIRIKDSSVQYHTELAPVQGVDATVLFENEKMDINVTAGHIGKATLKKGRVWIDDFGAQAYDINIAAEVEGPASEVGNYLQQPFFSFGKTLNLQPEQMTGSVTGKLAFAAAVKGGGSPQSKKAGGLDFAIEAKGTGISTPALLGEIPVQDASITAKVSPSIVELSGQGSAHGAPTSIDLKVPLHTKEAQLEYTLNVQATTEQLGQLGIKVPALLSGQLGIQAAVKQTGATRLMTNKVDITAATVNLNTFGYTKPAGEKGTLEFKAKQTDGNPMLEVSDIYVNADNLMALGKLAINTQTESLAGMAMDKVVFGKNDFAVALTQTKLADGSPLLQAALTGASVDLSGMYNSNELFTDGGFDLPHMRVMADVSQLLLGDGKELRGFNGSATCTSKKCIAAKASAKFANGKPLDLSLAYENNQRVLRITTDDAGTLIEVLGITDNIRDGRLELTAHFEDDKPDAPLVGVATIKDYTLRKAPVLTKLLNVASLTGIVELLQGGGVAFKEMVLPFTVVQGVITVKEGKSHGDSLGITASGTINTRNEQLDLKGTIVPSYMVNSLVGNIPIVGDVLTGGEGKGIFAANYTVTGPYSEANVDVNPLSMLAPGFLRNLFGGGG